MLAQRHDLQSSRWMATGFIVALLGSLIATLPMASPASADSSTYNFGIPASAFSFKVTAIGAGGGGGYYGSTASGDGGAGGDGALVTSYIRAPGAWVKLGVGNSGNSGLTTTNGGGPVGGAGGTESGGDGIRGGGGGGGASVLELGSSSSSTTPWVVAGGGGGGGRGNSNGNAGVNTANTSGAGGNAGAVVGGAGGNGGSSATGTSAPVGGSGGGSSGAGGAGGAGAGSHAGWAGATGSSFINGGAGGDGIGMGTTLSPTTGTSAGSGGGGGGYGGGGGGGYSNVGGQAGGGAGGSWVRTDSLSSAVTTDYSISTITGSGGRGGSGGIKSSSTDPTDGTQGSVMVEYLAQPTSSSTGGFKQMAVTWSAAATPVVRAGTNTAQPTDVGTISYQVHYYDETTHVESVATGAGCTGTSDTVTSGTCTITNLTPTHRYDSSAVATTSNPNTTDKFGLMTYGSGDTALITGVPAAPTLNSVTPSDGTLTVAFTAGSNMGSSITGYEYTTDGTTYAPLPSPFTTITQQSSDGASLVNGTSYPIAIKAVNANGESDASNTVNATPCIPPDAPTITSIDNGDKTLSVNFNPPGSDGHGTISTYQYSTDGGGTWKARASGTTASPLVIGTVSGSSSVLTNGSSYSVKIRAVNASGTGAASDPLSAVPGQASAPSITDIAPSDKQLSVAFNPPSNNGGATLTTYQYSTDGGSTWKTRDTGTILSPLTITTESDTSSALTNGTSYNIELRAVNGLTTALVSTPVAATPAVAPGAPSITSVTAGDGSLAVDFDAPNPDGDPPTQGYEYTTNGTDWHAASQTTSPITISGLTNGTTYHVQLRALNSVLTGTASTAVDGTPGQASAPTINSIDPGDGSLSVNFTGSSDNGGATITTYDYSTDGGAHWKALSSPSTSSPLVIDTESDTTSALQNGMSYDVKIRAVNGLVDGVASNQISGTPRTTPSAPSIVSVTNADTELDVLLAQPSSNGGDPITSYEYTTDSGTTWAALTEPNPEPVLPSGQVLRTFTATSDGTALTNGSEYHVSVRAVNGAGGGDASTSATGVPGQASAPTINQIDPAESELSVDFNAPVNDGGSPITGYEYSTDAGTSWQPRSGGALVSPLVITTLSTDGTTPLSNGVSYPVEIRAVNALTTGAASDPTSATPRAVPNRPTINSITNGDGQLTVDFAAPTDQGGSAITNYEYSTDHGTSWLALDPASTNLSMVIDKPSSGASGPLTNGTEYPVEIRAVNAAGSGATTPATLAMPGQASAPAITEIDPGNQSLAVKFAGPTANGGHVITNYQYSTDNGDNWATLSPAATTSPIAITAQSANGSALVNGHSYPVKIRALNTLATGVDSAASSSTPRTTASQTVITSITNGDRQLSTYFDAPTSNGGSTITTYEYSTDGGSTWRARSTASTVSPLVIDSLSSDGTALSNGVVYSVELHAVNAAGNGVDSAPVSATPGQASAPAITEIDPGNHSLSVKFTGSSANGGLTITSYEYSTDAGAHWRAISGDSTVSPMTITVLSSDGTTTLTNGQTYPIQLRAQNGVDGIASASVDGVPKTLPDVVTGSATDLTKNSVTLHATVTAEGATTSLITIKYDPSQSVVDGGGGSTATVAPTSATGTDPTDITATLTGLSPLTTYHYRVSATNSEGTADGETLSFKTTDDPTTTTLAATQVTRTTAQLHATVNANGDPTTALSIRYSDVQADVEGNGGYDADIAPTSASGFDSTDISADLDNLAMGKKYYYRVSATNGNGTTSGEVKDFTTEPQLPAPTIDSVTPDNLSLTVVFHPNGDAGSVITDYEYSTDDGVDFVSAESTSTTITITTQSTSGNPSLVNGDGYPIKIRAKNAFGSGLASDAVAGTPRTIPGQPTAVVGAIGNQSISLSWTAPADNGGALVTGYEIQIADHHDGPYSDATGGCAFSTSRTSASTSCVAANLTNGSSYFFRVAAINAAGPSAYSEVSGELSPATSSTVPTQVVAVVGNASATVTWVAPDDTGGRPIDLYTVTATPGGQTCVSNAPSCIVTGLSNGVQYSFTVVAHNSLYLSEASAPSSVVTPGTPAAPRIKQVLMGSNSATLQVEPRSTGGSVTKIEIQAYSSGKRAGDRSLAVGTGCTLTMPSTQCVVDGLKQNRYYSFTAVAMNASASTGQALTRPRRTGKPAAPVLIKSVALNGGMRFIMQRNRASGGTSDQFIVKVAGHSQTCQVDASANARCTITGLRNNKTYRFRLYATNAAGTSKPAVYDERVRPNN